MRRPGDMLTVCHEKSKQEEIREGMKYILLNNFGATVDVIVPKMVEYLHSQDVVIKVNRELPHSHYANLIFQSKKKSDIKDNLEMNGIYEEGQEDMLNADYVAVEPLI